MDYMELKLLPDINYLREISLNIKGFNFCPFRSSKPVHR